VIYLTVDRRAFDNAFQVSIGEYDEKGGGHGYRIAGPKYDGKGSQLLKKKITKQMAEEIMSYLRKATDET
jgi:hypothetical protein